RRQPQTSGLHILPDHPSNHILDPTANRRLDDRTPQFTTMKPVVSAFNAWTCVVISVFAIVILSVIGALFKTNNHSMMGSEEDPADGAAVAASVFGAVAIYGAFLVFCAGQAYLHQRDRSRGAIALS
ncbi:hypothetical protein KCU91_g18932, partial [Aureobasidium melanogenum]